MCVCMCVYVNIMCVCMCCVYTEKCMRRGWSDLHVYIDEEDVCVSGGVCHIDSYCITYGCVLTLSG